MPYETSSPEITRWCALLIAVVLSIPTISSLVHIFQAEDTGVAYYNPNPKLPPTDRVMRTTSPTKFHDAVFAYGEQALLFGSITIICFWFYRRLSE
jgi:hypothetical protein